MAPMSNIPRVLEVRADEAEAYNKATVSANEELIRLETIGLMGCCEGAGR